MELIQLSPAIKDSIGRTYELVLNLDKYPSFIIKNHGLDKNSIEKLQKHFPNCIICQMFHNNYKKYSDNAQSDFNYLEKERQIFIQEKGFSGEFNDKSIHKNIFDDFDKEEWNELSKKDREYFERTVLKDLLDINDKLKSVDIAKAELIGMEECNKVKSLKKRYDKIENEIKELIGNILFGQFKKSYSCNLVYLNGSGHLDKFSMTFIRMIDTLEKEYEEHIVKTENSIFIKIMRAIEKTLSGKKPLIKIILEHIENA